MRALKILLGIFVIIEAVGCTTIRGRSQRMKVDTVPGGAEVFYNGKLLGKTPGWVEVPRKIKGTLTFERKGFEPINIGLTPDYRWGDSFFSDLIFLYAAPAAIAIDLITGTAWDFEKINPLTFGGAKQKHYGLLSPPDNIVIAPPKSDSVLLSDEVGEKLYALTMTRFRASHVRPYDDTSPVFTEYSYTHYGPAPAQHTDDMYFDLGATHILESEVVRQKNGVFVKARLVDMFSEQEVASFADTIPAGELKNFKPNSTQNTLVNLLSLVPNTFTFDFDTPSSSFSSATISQSYQGVADPTNTVFGFLSSFGFRSVKSPKLVTSFKPVFEIVPLVSFQYNHFHFTPNTGTNLLANDGFDWFTLYTGAGPEVGLESPLGYFYADLIPCYDINWIDGSGNGTDASDRQGGFTFVGEVGYQLFLSERINVRLFARSSSVPSDAWSHVLSDLSGQPISVDQVTRGIGGLSIGYYFPEDRRFLKKVLFQ